MGNEDELCAFEKLPFNTLSAAAFSGVEQNPKSSDGFVRYTLKEALRYYDQMGLNPWQMGLIASTDNHLGTPGAVEEYSFVAHTAVTAFVPQLAARGALQDSLDFNPGGLAAAWAEENTRDSIFDAFKRGEVYGTSGPRIQLRFFASAHYDKGMCELPDKIQRAYQQGIPMGGVLDAEKLRASGKSPHFMVHAVRDTGTETFPGTPLQRIQIIKGWLDKNGKKHEYVYDLKVAEGSEKASVNTDTCERTGQGADQMCVIWPDHGFDAKENAWYYARAVENPSCRWSRYACKAKGVDCSRPETLTGNLAQCCNAPATIQERAWSSPIWYYAR
jgi:hypothetical protein